jgi:hypothetical protein
MSLDISLLPAMHINQLENRSQTTVHSPYLYVVLLSDGNRLLSFDDFSLILSAEMKNLNNLVLIHGVQKTLKLKQLKEMAGYLERISESFRFLNSKVDETKLLAINTLINASFCGLSGKSFSEVIKQVNLVCNQSKNFLNDIKNGIESTHVALDGILNLIKSTVETEMNTMTALKSTVDFYLGKLSAHQHCHINQDKVGYYPFQDLVETDFQQLLKSVVSAHDHVAFLISKRHQDASLIDNMGLCLQQLKIFSTASLLSN